MFKKFLVWVAILACCVCACGEENSALKTDDISEASDVFESMDIADFEKEALKNANRALELSMYYQGWEANECFFAFEECNKYEYEKTPPITRTLVKNSELSRQIEMRDFDKALHWAEIAFNLEKKKEYIDEKVGLNIMKLYITRGEDFAKETYDFFVKNLANYDFEKEGKVYSRDFARAFDGDRSWAFTYRELYAYFYFKGFGVKQDINFASDILKYLRVENWRSFYLSKYYIKDLEFVKFLMESDGEYIANNHFLYLIYSGKFNASEEDETLAKKHFNIYEKIRNDTIKSLTTSRLDNAIKDRNNPSYNNPELISDRVLTSLYLEKYIYLGFLFDKILLIPNSYYNLELGEKIINKPSSYSKHRLILCFLLNSFSIKDAKKYYNKILSSRSLSEEEKSNLEYIFKCHYNSAYNVIFNNPYSFDLKIDFDNL